jgi:hypothetical protein
MSIDSGGSVGAVWLWNLVRPSSAPEAAAPIGRTLPVLFVHTPKTAGSTMHRHMVELVGAAGVAVLNKRVLGSGFDWADYRDRRYIGGHFRYPDAVEAFPHATYVTSLRDPLHRVLSHFHMAQRDGSAEAAEPGTPDYTRSLTRFLDHPGRRKTNNLQCRFIAGRPLADLAIDTLERRFALVWAAERTDEAVHAVARLLAPDDARAATMRVGRHNAAPTPVDYDAVVPPALRDRILEENAADARLYAHLRDRHGGFLDRTGVPS